MNIFSDLITAACDNLSTSLEQAVQTQLDCSLLGQSCDKSEFCSVFLHVQFPNAYLNLHPDG